MTHEGSSDRACGLPPTFRDLNLSRKLLLILMVTSVGALLVAGIAITAREAYTSRQSMMRELTLLGEVVGTNSAAALSFRDQQAGREVLSSLRARLDIAHAALLLPNGSLFCTYARPGERPLRLTERPLGPRIFFARGRLILVHPIRLTGEVLGSLYLECTMDELNARVRDAAISVLALVLASALFAYALSLRLERLVSEPIRRLSEAAQRVSASQDYSVRVDWPSRDELGVLTESFNHMLAQIEEQNRALRESEGRLLQAQKMEAVGQLAGGVAHDFNNLLTVINGYASLLESRTPPEDPRRSKIDQILKAGERAASLTRQLLAFGRKQMLEAKVFDLRENLGNMEKMLRRLIGEDIRLVWVLGPDVPRVKADPGQIEQVVMNLVVNSRDAMPSGGTITVEVASAVLDEAYASAHAEVRPGRYAFVAVSDTGAGIPPEIQSRIFEPFFTTKETGKGTGLGLATVYGIIKQSGGHITLYSEQGVGTTFKVYLPASADSGEAEQPAAPEPVPRGSAETILLVEDEPLVRELARDILDSQGYRVLSCGDPGEAIKVCEGHPGTIDLLLTDVIMPGINGRDLYVRLSPRRPGMRVLYMSGYTDRAIVHQGTLASGTAFIQKPFTPGALGTKVREVLDGLAEAA